MIALECFPDEVLVRTLGIPATRIIHAMGKGNVINKVTAGKAVVGLIDEDPNSPQPNDLKQFSVTESAGALIRRTCPNLPHKSVVVIRPRLEEWLYGRARACDIKPRDLGLTESPRELKQSRYDTSSKYQELLRRLLDADAEMKKLQKWLSQA